MAVKSKPVEGGVDNRAAETDPIATAARGVSKGRKGKKPKSKHKGELEEVGRKGILIQPPRPPPPKNLPPRGPLEEVGRKGILVNAQPNPQPKPKSRDIEEQVDKGSSLDSRTAPSVADAEQGEEGQDRNKKEQLLPSGLRFNLLLGFGIILGLIGATLLVALGVLYVKPYTKVQDLKLTSCMATLVSLTDELVTCTCASDGSQSCLSRYPCLKLWVNFTTLRGEEMTNVTLYDSYETFILQHNVLKCSFHKCSRVSAHNYEAVQAFTDEHVQGSKFSCYYRPDQPDFAIKEVVTQSTIIHCMLWPSIGLILGVTILFIHICDNGQSSPRSSPFNSLERPWLRYAERNYEKVGTLSDHYNS